MASGFNKILFLTYGGWQHASSRIRALNYIQKLAASNAAEIHWLPRAPERGKTALRRVTFFFLKRHFLLKRFLYILFCSWDLIFVQRTFLSPILLKIITWKNIPMVYDFDDAIYLGGKKNFQMTKAMLKNARKVVVSSPVLSEFCAHHRIIPEIIPSPIDENIYKDRTKTGENNNKTITIGWIGSPWTEHYLTAIQPVLREIASEPDVKISLMGASNEFKMENIPLNKVDWSLEKEGGFLENLDIGIMPLDDDEWSKGKGGYKIYQYMAAGIPVVASPIGVNNEIVENEKTGFLATNLEEWKRYLMLLIVNKLLREEIGLQGREKFENNYSYKVCTPLLDKVFKEALDS